MALPFENRQKVANIVDAQANLFKDVYHRLVVGLPGVHWATTGSTIQVCVILAETTKVNH